MFRKLQWQLTAIFALLLIVLLLASNVMIYILLETSNRRRLDSDIEAILETVENSKWATESESDERNEEDHDEGEEKEIDPESLPLPDREPDQERPFRKSSIEDHRTLLIADGEAEEEEEAEEATDGDVEEVEPGEDITEGKSEEIREQEDDETEEAYEENSHEVISGEEESTDRDIDEKDTEEEQYEAYPEKEREGENQEQEDEVIDDSQEDKFQESKDLETNSEHDVEHEEQEENVDDYLETDYIFQVESDQSNDQADIIIPAAIADFPYYIVSDMSGRTVLVHAKNLVLEELLATYQEGFDQSDSPMIIDLNEKGMGYYLMARGPVTVDDVQYGTITVAENITLAFDTLNQLRQVMIWVMIIGVLIASVIGYILAGRFIQPVREAYQLKERFIGDASHELRTPLSVLQLSMDLMRKDHDRMSKVSQNTLEDMRDETNRMKGLVERLLFIARHDAHTLVLEKVPVSLREILFDLGEGYRKLAEAEEKSFNLNLTGSLQVLGDQQMLQTVFATLLDNALKYSQPGGMITITSYLVKVRRRQMYRIMIENTGEGVASEEIERIFERFYREDTARSRSADGYGLGLAIAKDVIEAHEGTIKAESEPGQFFRIVLNLPALV